MFKKLLAAGALAVLASTFVATPSAEALMLPATDGQVDCGLVGKITARPIRSNPTLARVRIAGALAGCSYNGNPLPSLTGRAASSVVVNTTQVCSALADGSASARTVVRVKLGTTTVANVVVNLAVSVADAGAASAINATGSTTISGTAISASVNATTNRPLGDLCTGATREVLYAGMGSLAWDRP